MNEQFKLDSPSIQNIIRYLQVDDIPTMLTINKRYNTAIEHMKTIPYFNNTFTPKLLQYFPCAKTIQISLTNYSNEIGDNSNNILHTIYIGKEKQVFDLNYIAELRGKKTNIEIDVQGALKDNAKKNFKGTIDFKKGAKKA